MSSRDIWLKPGTPVMRDILGSVIATRLLHRSDSDPLYLAAPFLTDFPLLDNRLGQYATLFRDDDDLADRGEILFSESLIYLARFCPVYVMGVQGPSADPFLFRLIQTGIASLQARYVAEPFHVKGMACDRFFIEGSMNFTYKGLYKREEKVTVHHGASAEGRRRIDAAILELERLWESRSRFAVQQASP